MASQPDDVSLPPIPWRAVALAGLVRVAVVVGLNNTATVTGYESEEIARHLLAGHGYSHQMWGTLLPSAYQYPAYTLILAAVFALGGGVAWWCLELLQCVVGALSVVVLHRLVCAVADHSTAAAASWIWALHPVAVYWCTMGQPMVWEWPLLMALWLGFLHLAQARGTRAWLGVGLLLGLAVLFKTLYVLMLPVLAAWALLNRGVAVASLVRRLALATAVMGLVLAPWAVRNRLVLGQFIWGTTNGGVTLWLGANDYATGGVFAADGTPLLTHVPLPLQQQVAPLDEVTRDRVFAQHARAWIAAHPWEYLALVPRKLACLWWFEPYGPSRFPALRAAVWLGTLPFALAGLWLMRRRWRAYAVAPATWVLLSVVYSIFHGGPRFRYAVEFSFVIPAAHALVHLWKRRAGEPHR